MAIFDNLNKYDFFKDYLESLSDEERLEYENSFLNNDFINSSYGGPGDNNKPVSAMSGSSSGIQTSGAGVELPSNEQMMEGVDQMKTELGKLGSDNIDGSFPLAQTLTSGLDFAGSAIGAFQSNPLQKKTGLENASTVLGTAGKGALLGSQIAPGIGTAIGGIVGAVTGLIGNQKANKEYRKMQTKLINKRNADASNFRERLQLQDGNRYEAEQLDNLRKKQYGVAGGFGNIGYYG